MNSTKAVAVLSPYEIVGDYELTQYEYVIGFEIDKSKVMNFGTYFENSLVYIGEYNPFTQKNSKILSGKKYKKKRSLIPPKEKQKLH